jgi:hypothetical protein
MPFLFERDDAGGYPGIERNEPEIVIDFRFTGDPDGFDHALNIQRDIEVVAHNPMITLAKLPGTAEARVRSLDTNREPIIGFDRSHAHRIWIGRNSREIAVPDEHPKEKEPHTHDQDGNRPIEPVS